MVSARRVILLRVTAIVAVCVSTLLTYDSLNPGRAFCPLAEACERARGSALGVILGIPTSIVGMAAFGGLFLLTLLPIEWARTLLKPAGLLAALAGAGLFAFQAIELDAFCPLCLVADTAGLIAGLVTLTWGQLPRRRSGRRLAGESAASRTAWSLAMVLAVVVPFAWPRPASTGWVEIAPTTASLFEGEDAPAPVGKERAATEPEPPLGAPPAAAPAPRPLPPAPPGPPGAALPPRPSPSLPGDSSVPPPAPAVGPTPSLPSAAGEPRVPTAPRESRPPARPEVQIVEYINAYCAHCRATHKRLRGVLSSLGVTGRFRRVYTWAGNEWPLWARACAYAQSVGLEERLFEELLVARDQGAGEVHAAARRAGLDAAALRQALQDPTPPARLVRDRALALAAGLSGLPTLDIGRRRLMGEQSEAELRDAVQAALPR